MRPSFRNILEHMAAAEQRSDDAATDAVRAGINLRPDFWDDFIQITGNADGMAELLDVPKHKVAQWASKIYKILDQVKDSDDGEAAYNKAKTLSTGT